MYRYLFRGQTDTAFYSVEQVKTTTGEKVSVLQEHKNDLKEFALVSVVKFVLTEGEKFIIFAFRDFVRLAWGFNDYDNSLLRT